jgi:hypothetical protein
MGRTKSTVQGKQYPHVERAATFSLFFKRFLKAAKNQQVHNPKQHNTPVPIVARSHRYYRNGKTQTTSKSIVRQLGFPLGLMRK